MLCRARFGFLGAPSRLFKLNGGVKAHASAATEQQPQTASGTWLALDEYDVNVCGRALKLVKPSDIDGTFDWYIAQGREEPPFWADVWGSAVAMAVHLARNPELVAGKTVVEIGGGLGLVSIVCALLGAQRVVMLDNEPAALQCALLSGTASGVASAPAAQVQWPASPTACPLAESQDDRTLLAALQARLARNAGQPTQSIAQHHNETTAETNAVGGSADTGYSAHFAGDTHTLAQLSHELAKEHDATGGGQDTYRGNSNTVLSAEYFDWHKAYTGPTADVVIACDVLYESTAPLPLARVLPQLFADNTADQKVLLADPPQRTKQNRLDFMAALAEADSSLAVELNRIVSKADTGAELDIQLMCLRRRRVRICLCSFPV